MNKTVSLKTFVVVVFLFSVALAFFAQIAITKNPGEESSWYYTPQGMYSYVVGAYNSTHYYLQNQSGYGRVGYDGYDFESLSDDTVLTYAIDNLTASGGTVFVKSGSYTATVTLKSNVRLILDKGVSGITVNINAGATCTLEDHNTDVVKHYEAGTLSWIEDFATGYLLTSSANFTTVYVSTMDALVSTTGVKILKLVVQNGTGFPASPLTNQMFYRTDWKCLYVYDGAAWQIVAYPPTTYPYANLTGTPDLLVFGGQFLAKNGTVALTADWNTGAFGIYGATWVNSTSINFGTLYNNGVQVGLVQPATFTINVTGSTYSAWYGANSTLFTSSTNASAVINNAIGNCSIGGSIFAKAGTFTFNNPILLKYGILLQGEGAGVTNFFFNIISAVDCIQVNVGGTAQNYGAIKDLTIFKSGGSSLNGIYIYRVSKFTIEDCDIRSHGNNGVYFDNAYTCYVRGGHIASNDGAGVFITNYCTGINLQELEIHDNTGYNVIINGSSGNTIGPDVHFENYATACGHIEIINGRYNKIIYSNLDVTLGNYAGVYIYNNGSSTAEYNQIVGNHFSLTVSSNYAVYANYSSQIVNSNTFLSCGGGIYLASNYNHVEGNTLDTCGAVVANGITVGSYSKVISNDLLNIVGTAIQHGGYCAVSDNHVSLPTSRGIYTSGSYSAISGNTLSSCGNDGINLDGADYCEIYENAILNSGDYGIQIEGTALNNKISGNRISGSSSGAVSDPTGLSTVYYKNIGFVTENSVSGANTTATTCVLNTGLAGAVTYAWLSFNDTAIESSKWVPTGATQITVIVTGTLPASWTCYAKVEYAP